MRYDVLDVVPRDSVAGGEFFDHLREDADGKFEDLAAVLAHLLAAPRMPSTYVGCHVTVGAEDVVNESRSAFSLLQDHSPGAVAEEHAGGAVLGVHYGGQDLRPDEQDPRGGAAKEHRTRD